MMKNWIKTNLRNIIVTAFVVPILLVAFVSISHVTTFYGLSNPFTWAIYLSVAIEIAALAALAAVSVKMGKFVYVPFIIVTLIQFVGNLYFSFTYIDETSEGFKEWMNMVGSLLEPMGVDPSDPIAHKRILSLLSGGLLPIISLTFAHMLVVYTDQLSEVQNKSENKLEGLTEEQLDAISREAGKIEYQNSQKEVPTNITNLDKIEEYLTNLNSSQKVDNVVSEENTTSPSDDLPQIVINEVEPDSNPENENVESQPPIKRLTYSGRNG